MADVTYRETVLAWDEPRRWAYRVDECSIPLFAVLLEDWVIESVSERESIMHWTFAFEPLPRDRRRARQQRRSSSARRST